MTELDTLENLGLSNAESRVYLALLEEGSSLAGPIIKKTGLHRGTTYQILQRLIQKGLVNFVVKGKKRHFEAADPKQFLIILKEKEEQLKQILPALEQKRKLSEEKQEVEVYSGLKGIRTVCLSILEELNPNGEYLDFGVSGMFRYKTGALWDLWQRKKIQYGIKSKIILDESIRKKDPNFMKDYHGEARFSEFKSFTDTMIFNDTVVLFIWTAQPLLAIVIKNKDNAESYRNQFKIMWKNAKSTL